MHYLQRGLILDATDAEASGTVVAGHAGSAVSKVQVAADGVLHRTAPVQADDACHRASRY